MPQKKNSRNLKSYRNRVRSKQTAASGRKLDYFLILVSVLVIAFVGSFALKYSVGESSPPPQPPCYLRFQVLNGCGVDGAAAKFSRFMRERSTAEIVIDIIDEGNFSSFDQERTLLLVRDATAYEVESVADLVGFSDEQVVHKKLDDNLLDINFTVLLGEDFTSFFRTERPES